MNNMEKTRIEGTYGDEVDLYHNGYVSTKYGEFFKIKSVDFEKHEVEVYGDGTYGFSRISFSMPDCEEGKSSYLEAMKYYLEFLDIKVGSIVNLSKLNLEDLKEHNFKINEIKMPKMEGDDYLIKIAIQNTSNRKEYLYTILDFSDFKMQVEVISTPHTLEEKLRKNLQKHSNFSGEIIDKDKYIQSLLEIIKNE